MLSATYEVTDIKTELETYDVYGYSTDSEFITAINNAIATAKRERMLPILGIDGCMYDLIAEGDKSDLDDYEIYIYWAEVYYSIAEFCLFHARRDKYRRRSARESRTQGDVTYSNSGATGKELMAYDYISKGDKSFAEAGYQGVQVKLLRRATMYGF